MYGKIKEHLQAELSDIENAGLFKKERIITSAQDAVIKLDSSQEVVNFCSNNYLGLSSHPKVVSAAKAALDSHGFGMSSVLKSPNSVERKIQSYMQQHLMQMAEFLSLFLALKMLLFPIPLTMPQLLTELDFVKLLDIVMQITIWKT